MMTVKAVLFDLDGTLLDTAPDLVYALNCLRAENGLSDLSYLAVKPLVSVGSKAMTKLALGLEENDPTFSSQRDRFLDLYEEHLAKSTRLYPGIEKVLTHLETRQIPWGIVTNKLTRHTIKLLKELRLHHRPACIICGDSLSTYKPDPQPILYACELIKQLPSTCLYVGDSSTDVIASKAAGTRALVALYGYIADDDNPQHWGADGYIKEPEEILNWI